MTVVRAADALGADGWHGPVEVVVEDGRIVAIGPATGPVPDRVLVPGLVDLQVNGHDDVDVATADGSDWERLDRLLVAQGVTTWCPTLVTAPLESYAGPLARLAAATARPGPRPAIAGVHLEGPFLGGRPGAHPVDHVRPVDAGWLAALPPHVRLVTLAPDAPGALAAIGPLAERGVLVSLGHSAASYEETRAATAAGARLVTHCFNATGALHQRAPGLLGAALSDDRLAVSVIADLAHVHPALLALAFRAKGRDGVALVTDAVAWRSGRIGELTVAAGPDGVPRRPDGTLAGSALTLDRAVRNVVTAAGVDLADGVRAASTTPARLLGLTDRGELRPGARADLVALGPTLEVEATWIDGEQVR
ncbi:MAG: amidohydrolase family protein [Acidimicrobiales bacterium]|nr:amidohydrolase family protein [Acidimicrobiales bacterium]